MNVVHIAESFSGGVLDFIAGLCHELQDMHHIIIHGLRDDTPETYAALFPAGTEFRVWRQAGREIRPARDLKAFTELVSLLRPVRTAEIFHLHSSKAGFLGRVACRRLGIHRRVLYSPHGVSFLRKDVSCWKAKMYTLLERSAYSFGGEVVCSSVSESEAFAAIGIAARSISNGIACSGAVPPRAPSGSIRIGISARITAQKNPRLFNDIAREFLEDHSVRFIWLGDGELRSELSSGNIDVLGWMSRDALIEHLQDIDIYLSTSQWEGMPLSVLMGMCAGKPLVLSACVGNRDLVAEGINGFTFRTKDEAVRALSTLRNNSLLAREMGICSRRRVMEEFSLERMATEYRALYNRISV